MQQARPQTSTGVPCSTPRMSSGARYKRAMIYAAELHTQKKKKTRKQTQRQHTDFRTSGTKGQVSVWLRFYDVRVSTVGCGLDALPKSQSSTVDFLTALLNRDFFSVSRKLSSLMSLWTRLSLHRYRSASRHCRPYSRTCESAIPPGDGDACKTIRRFRSCLGNTSIMCPVAVTKWSIRCTQCVSACSACSEACNDASADVDQFPPPVLPWLTSCRVRSS